MSDFILYGCIFIIQIFVISIYYPSKIVKRIRYVIAHFPPSKYPKLYPQGTQKTQNRVGIFIAMNGVITAIGLTLFFIIFVYNGGKFTAEDVGSGVPLAFAMVQFIPFLVLEFMSHQQFKLMRKGYHSTQKKASLAPRHFLDLVSSSTLVIAIFALLAYLFSELFLPSILGLDSQIQWSRIVSMFLVHTLYTVIIYFALVGKKMDPYQAESDRKNHIIFTIDSLLVSSILISVFFTLSILVNLYELDRLEFVTNSLFMQFVVILGIGKQLRFIKLANLNFDVYKVSTEN